MVYHLGQSFPKMKKSAECGICSFWAPILRRRHPSKYQFLALMNVLIILGPWQRCPIYPISLIHPISLLIIFGLLEVPGHLVIVEACHTSSSWKPGGAGSFPFRDIGSPIWYAGSDSFATKVKWSQQLPSGKRLHNYGRITIFNGKINYFYGHVQ